MDTVKVPPQFESIFKIAEKYVREYFKEFKADPSKGTIEISDERYILVRAASMSVDFFETIKNLYRGAGEDEAHNVALQLLFDVAHAIGKQDAKKFHLKMGVEDPVARLSAGPILFAYSGWAHVNISSDSKPTPDENFYLLYDHPYSFESSAWIKQGMHSKFPVCIMNAGYSSGWCEESFGVPLVATEITCKAKGDDACRFIMGHPSKIESYIKKYIKKTPSLANKNINYEIPGFFKRKELEEQLRQSEARYRTQFEESTDAIFIADFVSGILIDCNKAAEKLVERTREEIIGKPQRILHPDSEVLGALSKTFLQHIDDAMGQTLDSEVITKSGDIKYVSIRSNILTLQGKKLLSGVFRDVTARRKAEIALRKRMDFEQIIGNIAKQFSGLSYDKLDNGLQNSLNTVAKHVGFSRAYIFLFSANRKTLSCIHEWFTSSVKSLFHLLQNFSLNPYKNFLNAIEHDEMIAIMDVESLPKSWNNEKKLWKRLDIKSLIAFPLILQNERIGFVGFDAVHEKKLWNVDDTSLLNAYSEIVAAALERKRVGEKMEQLAKYDNLTNLPNRLYFEETLEREIAKALRHNYMFSILSLDLDKFKFVNDTFGHSVGDLLLVEIAERLRTTVRKEDFIARLGGDEFVSIIIAINSPHAAGVIAKKIVNAIGTTYTIGGHEFMTSASIGIAMFPDDGGGVETLMKNADIAMYQAKQNGGNNYQYYHRELSEQHLKRMHLENALKSALQNNEFFLVYQPQYDLITKKIIGMEALMRWNHPKLGLIPPEVFIPVTEDTNMIVELGQWLLTVAFTQYNKWRKKYPKCSIPLAINLSVVQLLDSQLIKDINKALKDSKVKASNIELELTETAIMRSTETSEDVLHKLAKKGFKIVIDDFGMGYSSLSRLKRLPVGTLKIDKSFIKEVNNNQDDASIVKTTIALAGAMGLSIVAEGIEDAQQLKFLLENGCTAGQGFYLSKPLLAGKMEELLKKQFG